MAIDLDKCIGCQACSLACRQENNIAAAGPAESDRGRFIFWNEVLYHTEGEYPHTYATWVPRPCMHCENTPCLKVCPVGATYRDDEGIVLVNYDRCIGCRYCAQACPYGARYFNWHAPNHRTTLAESLNPEVPVRPKGVMEKCTFCKQCIERAKSRKVGKSEEEKEFSPLVPFMEGFDNTCSSRCHEHPEVVQERDPGYDYIPVPACVQTCPVGARHFGDLNDPESEVSRLKRSPRAFHLLEHLGTEPKTFYLQRGEWHAEQA